MVKRLYFLSLSLGAGLMPLASVIAQEGASAGGSKETYSPLIGILLMLAVFFFLIILPQSRKSKKHGQFLSDLQKGDSVITQSGIYGTIYGLAEKVVTLEIAPNIRIRMDRQTIAGKDNLAVKGNK